MDYGQEFDPYTAELLELQRRRNIAQAQIAQGMDTGPVQHWSQGAARVVSSVLGNREAARIAEEMKGVAARRESDRAAEMDRVGQMLAPGEGAPQPSRQELARAMLGMKNPKFQALGLQMALQHPAGEEEFTLAEGAKRFRGKNLVAENPKAPDKPKSTELEGLFEMMGWAPDDPRRKEYTAKYIDRKVAPQGPTTVVNTGAKFGAEVASEVGKKVMAEAEAAKAGIDTIDAAQQVMRAVDTGKVNAGPGATWSQQAKAFAVGFGFQPDEKGIAATRDAIQGMSRLALAARGQLKGQGQISDFEGKLLQRASSGDIDTMTPQELRQVASVADRAARARIRANSANVKRLQGNPAFADLLPFMQVEEPPAYGGGGGYQIVR